jgi:uncharacterized protein involved in exopolysaccharide biosynthesis
VDNATSEIETFTLFESQMSSRVISPDPIDLILEAMFRHKWKIVLLPLLVIALVVLIVIFYPRRYISEARILVQVGRQSVGIDPTASTGAMISLMQSGRDDEMTSAIEVIKSREVLSMVVDRLGASVILAKGGDSKETNPVIAAVMEKVGQAIALLKSIDPISEREEAIIELAKSISIDVERGSTIMQWTVEADEPELAQLILKELIDVYQQEHLRIHRNQNSKQFFVNQLEKLELDLATAQEKLRDAKNEIGVVSIMDRRGTLEGKLREIEIAKYTADQNLARTNATISNLQSQMETVPSREVGDRVSMPNAGTDNLNAQLYALKVKRLDLTSRFREDHPAVQAITRQIAEAQGVVDAEDETREQVVNRINPIHESLILQLTQQASVRAGLEGLVKTLDSQHEQVMQELQTLNHAEVLIDDLTRRVAVSEKQFFRYSDDLEQARIDAEMQEQRISNISIVQPAALIERPVSPSKALLAIGGLFLAIGGTLAVVMACEKVDRTIKTAAAAEQLLNVPVFATLPKENRIGKLVG